MDNKKKIAAVSAAVMSYIRQEEEIAAMQAQSIQESEQASIPSAVDLTTGVSVWLNRWGVSGRQAQMQMRNMMQLKTFHR